ncbi:hypothetical protein GJ496_011064, partial [Pomphorhynchus laevis]
RVGQNDNALLVIVENLKDFDQAVQFCKKHNDILLWNRLSEFCKKDESTFNAFLNNMDVFLNPNLLFDNIAHNIKFKDVKESIEGIVIRYTLENEIYKVYNQLSTNETFKYMKKISEKAMSGFVINENPICDLCGMRIINTEDIVVLTKCNHIFHRDCSTDDFSLTKEFNDSKGENCKAIATCHSIMSIDFTEN